MYIVFSLVAPYSFAFWVSFILLCKLRQPHRSMAIIQLIFQSIYKLNYSILVVFMGFHENLLGFARPQNRLYYLPDYFFYWFYGWLIRLRFQAKSSLNLNHFFSKKLFDKILLKNYDVFIRTLHLMTCHQVLMEWQMTTGSKLITILTPHIRGVSWQIYYVMSEERNKKLVLVLL
jgi:hypothetical protein